MNVSISWSPPSQPNGVITDYNVTVYRSANTSDTVYRNTTATDTMVTASVVVSPFTNYTVSVSASTAAGEGESAEITITSPQAGRGTSFLAPFLLYSHLLLLLVLLLLFLFLIASPPELFFSLFFSIQVLEYLLYCIMTVSPCCSELLKVVFIPRYWYCSTCLSVCLFVCLSV